MKKKTVLKANTNDGVYKSNNTQGCIMLSFEDFHEQLPLMVPGETTIGALVDKKEYKIIEEEYGVY